MYYTIFFLSMFTKEAVWIFWDWIVYLTHWSSRWSHGWELLRDLIAMLGQLSVSLNHPRSPTFVLQNAEEILWLSERTGTLGAFNFVGWVARVFSVSLVCWQSLLGYQPLSVISRSHKPPSQHGYSYYFWMFLALLDFTLIVYLLHVFYF